MPVLETRRPRPGLARSALTTGRTTRSEPLDALPECPAAPARLCAGLGAPNRGEIQGGPPWAQVPRTAAGGPGTAALLPRMWGLSRHGTALSPSVSGQGGRPRRNPEGGQVDRLSRLCTGWKGPSLSRKASRGDRRNTDSEPSSALKWAPGLSAGPSAPSARGPSHQAWAQPADPSPSLSCAAHARGPGGGAAQAQTHPDPHGGL